MLQFPPENGSELFMSIFGHIMSHEQRFKVVFCGNSAVGKTSIVQRYCFNSFTEQMIPTMGADFVSHSIHLPEGEITFQIWDTAGQEQYQAIGPLFYRDATLAFVVYSVTEVSPLNDVQNWITRMHAAEANAKIVVFGNKIDLVGNANDTVEEWCTDHQIPHFFCSALGGTGLQDGFQRAATMLLATRPAADRLTLSPPRPPTSHCC
jgi:small GTP-binding protein